jgi:hypothetical protein
MEDVVAFCSIGGTQRLHAYFVLSEPIAAGADILPLRMLSSDDRGLGSADEDVEVGVSRDALFVGYCFVFEDEECLVVDETVG